MTCQGFLCHALPGAELRLYRFGRWVSSVMCRDCYEALVWSNNPPPPGNQFESLPLVQAEVKPQDKGFYALAVDLARTQAQQCQPIAPERAPTHPGAEEERIYLRDRVAALTVALNEAYRFAEAISEAPLNLAERTAAVELQAKINAALAGKGK